MEEEVLDLATKMEFLVWEAQQTAEARQKFQNNTFWQDKELMADLFDETPMKEEPCNRKLPMIGPNYQAIIPKKKRNNYVLLEKI